MRAASFALATALCAVAPASVWAEVVPDADYVPACGGLFDLCGYVERATRQELLSQVYEQALPFSEGLAAVRIDGLFGYIDKSGAVVIAPQYDQAGPFMAGRAEVSKAGLSGVTDRDGTVVVDPQYARALPFTAEATFVIPADDPGARYLPARIKDGFKLLLGGEFRLLRQGENQPGPERYEISYFDDPARGLIWAREGRDGLYGLLRADGTWQTSPNWMQVQPLLDGRAVVTTGEMIQGDKRHWGAVDSDGRLVIPTDFQWLSYFSNGFALTRGGSATTDSGVPISTGLVASDGTLLAGRHFDEAERPEWGDLPRVRMGEVWYGVDPDGALVDDPLDGRIAAECEGGLTVRHRAGGYEFSHPDLAAPLPQIFTNTYIFQKECGQPISVGYDGKWGYVTMNGRFLGPYTNTYGFQNGTAIVEDESHYGLLSESGKFRIEPKYDALDRFDPRFLYQDGWWLSLPAPSPERLYAKKDGRSFWVTLDGEEVPPPEVDRSAVLRCGEEAIRFADKGLWGMKRLSGEVLIAPEYRALGCYSGGVAWGAAVGDDQWCPIGPDGEKRTKPACQPFYEVSQISHRHPEVFASDPFESNVLWQRALLDFGSGLRDRPPAWVSDQEIIQN